MAVTDRDLIDSIAYEDEGLFLQLYDHLGFEDKFEYDHLMMLQDKLNTYIWYIDSKQYNDTYPGKTFNRFLIRIFFMFEPTVLCKSFIAHVNAKLSHTHISLEYVIDNTDSDGTSQE